MNGQLQGGAVHRGGRMCLSGTPRSARMEVFDPLDWLARVAAHIPDKGTQVVRYFRGLQQQGAGNEQETRGLRAAARPHRAESTSRGAEELGKAPRRSLGGGPPRLEEGPDPWLDVWPDPSWMTD